MKIVSAVTVPLSVLARSPVSLQDSLTLPTLSFVGRQEAKASTVMGLVMPGTLEVLCRHLKMRVNDLPFPSYTLVLSKYLDDHDGEGF